MTSTRFFVTRLGTIRERMDVNYAALTPEYRANIAAANYPLEQLGDLVVPSGIKYGTSAPTSETKDGRPILRMNNIADTGLLLSDVKFTTLDDSRSSAYLLSPGDVLVNRTNSKELVGKSAVFDLTGEWVFASYLLRVRVRPDRLLPEFLCFFLNSAAGRVQIDRLSRQIIGMANVSATELRALLIPVPPRDVQIRLVDAVMAANSSRREKLQKASEMLRPTISDLGIALGASRSAEPDRQMYGTRLRVAISNSHLDAPFFNPARIAAVTAIMSATHAYATPLADVADFVRDTVRRTPDVRFIGLGSVEGNTGELVDIDEEVAETTAFRFREDDVLFARLRPYLNKIWRAEFGGVCSTEFHVLRVKPEKADVLRPEYLAEFLRSDLTLAQTRHMATGNTLPRLAAEDARALLVSVPEVSIQERLANDANARRLSARELRDQALKEWTRAMGEFQTAVLGTT